MSLSHHVESFRFWDVVVLWARETLQHEHLVARALAKGVVKDGLRMQSVDPRWKSAGAFALNGAPFVGYVAKPGTLPVIVRSSALKHLLSVVETAAPPNKETLFEEFITKQDFRVWLAQNEISLPAFWFSQAER